VNKNLENTGLSVAFLCIIRIIPNLKQRGVIMDKVSVFEVYMCQCNFMKQTKVRNKKSEGKFYYRQECTHRAGPVLCSNGRCPRFPVVGCLL